MTPAVSTAPDRETGSKRWWFPAALLLAPVLISLAVYWDGLHTWFFQDDFAWLGLRQHLGTWRDLPGLLFRPMAQGTIRPLSERSFFMLFAYWFWPDALPFRVWVFLTQSANLVLLGLIARRLTGETAALFWAPVFWLVNMALATAMSWTSAYNQILCAFFLLAAFWNWLRYCQEVRTRYLVYQWMFFLGGFGALELNVVYPALAAAYAILCASRREVLRTIPMFAVSAVYAVMHRAVSPSHKSGVYAMHWDLSVVTTLGQYFLWAAGPERVWATRHGDRAILVGLSVLLLGALLIFLTVQIRRRQFGALFLVGWFVIVLGPVLPLQDHIVEYYLTIPTIGLATLGAWAAIAGWRAGGWGRAAAVVLAVIYLGCSTFTTRFVVAHNYRKSLRARDLVLGLDTARSHHPGRTLVLKGVAEELFWAGLADRPFRLIGDPVVRLAPGSMSEFQTTVDWVHREDYEWSPATTRLALEAGLAVVYDASGERLRNVTQSYLANEARAFPVTLPNRVDVSHPVFASLIGKGWYPAEGNYRWMGAEATLRMGGPSRVGQQFRVTGYVPEALLAEGPLEVEVTVSGESAGRFQLRPGSIEFAAQIETPASLVGRAAVEVVLRPKRSYVPPGESRVLSLAVISIEFR